MVAWIALQPCCELKAHQSYTEECVAPPCCSAESQKWWGITTWEATTSRAVRSETTRLDRSIHWIKDWSPYHWLASQLLTSHATFVVFSLRYCFCKRKVLVPPIWKYLEVDISVSSLIKACIYLNPPTEEGWIKVLLYITSQECIN